MDSRMSFVHAQLHGLRQQHGLITDEDDYSSRERFVELEKEYASFQRFFAGQWKHTKKRIRKNILWSKSKQEMTVEDASFTEETTVAEKASDLNKDVE